MSQTWSRTLSDCATALPGLSQDAESFLVSGKVPVATRFNVLLVIEELFTNCVKYGGKPDCEISLSLDIGDGHVRLTMSDDTLPFDPDGAPTPDLNRDLEEIEPGGLGLHIVKGLAREFSYTYRNGRNIVDLTLPTK